MTGAVMFVVHSWQETTNR